MTMPVLLFNKLYSSIEMSMDTVYLTHKFSITPAGSAPSSNSSYHIELFHTEITIGIFAIVASKS